MRRGVFIASTAALAVVTLRCGAFDADTSVSAVDASSDRPVSEASPEASSSTSDAEAPDSAPGSRASCAAILAAKPGAASGIYTLDPSGSPFRAYCDMTMDQGGWTLVARSVASSSANVFGWKKPTGSVDDDSQPYSLDATQLAPFDRLLFGARNDGKGWSAPVYRRSVPKDFLAVYGSTWTSEEAPAGVTSTCPGSGPRPTMLQLAGKTDVADHYLFGDQPVDDVPNFGLFPDGWDTNGLFDVPLKCGYSGLLTGLQGMIFVR